MINEFSVSVKPQNALAKQLMAICFGLSALIFALSMMIDKYRGVVAAFSLVTLTLALLLYTKYISARYVYEIFTDDDGEPLFIVRQLTGQKSVTLCRVEIATISKVEREDKKTRRAHKTERDVYRYSYCPTLSPEYVIRLSLVGYRAKSEILIEGSEDFAALLKAYAQEAKSRRGDGE